MVKNAGSKNKRGRLMKNMKSPNSGLMLIDLGMQIGMYVCVVRFWLRRWLNLFSTAIKKADHTYVGNLAYWKLKLSTVYAHLHSGL